MRAGPTNPNVPPALLAAVAAVSLAASVFLVLEAGGVPRVLVRGRRGLLSPTPAATYLTAFAFWAMVPPPRAGAALSGPQAHADRRHRVRDGLRLGDGLLDRFLLADLGYPFRRLLPRRQRGQLKALQREKGIAPRASSDVTSDKSVADAAAAVKKAVAPSTKKGKGDDSSSGGLVGIINCAGVGFNGPASYFPMATYQRQMDVNFFGYIARRAGALPLLDGVGFDEERATRRRICTRRLID